MLGCLGEDEGDRSGGDGAAVALGSQPGRRLQHQPGVAHEPWPVPRAGTQRADRGQQGGPAQPAVRIMYPPVQDTVCAHPADDVEPLDQGANNVDGERIDQGGQPCAPHEALDPGQVRVRQQADAGLQEHDAGEAPLEDGYLPQLGAKGGDVIARQSGVAAEGIADRSVYLQSLRRALCKLCYKGDAW